MIVELHLLQNFVPSNLNRDDTGSPKDCEFGGFRRARISSQCLKRAMRQHVKNTELLLAADLGHRTKRLLDELAKRVGDKPEDEVRRVAERLLGGKKITVKEGKTEYLLFLGDREIEGLAALIREHWDALAVDSAAAADAPDGKKKSAKDRKKEAAQAVPAEVAKALEKLLDGGKAADVAMFGRMLADLPEGNVDAACQVAHAISVNKANIEFDYYTAVDDLKPEDTAGADMIGTVELTSACFYRYAAIHTKQLVHNLQDDRELAGKTVQAFVRAAVEAVPTGKQNGTAAHNPPSLVMAVVRPSGCWNLANAFVKPVSNGGDGLVANAIKALDNYWCELTAMYPAKGLQVALCASPATPLPNLQAFQKNNVDEVFDHVAKALAADAAK